MCRGRREAESNCIGHIGVSKLLAASGYQDHERVHQKQSRCTTTRRHLSLGRQVAALRGIILRLLSYSTNVGLHSSCQLHFKDTIVALKMF